MVQPFSWMICWSLYVVSYTQWCQDSLIRFLPTCLNAPIIKNDFHFVAGDVKIGENAFQGT